MPRFDKYGPKTGGFRAPLNAAVSAANAFVMYGVGLNASGQVVIGAGNSGIIGVFIAHEAKNAGDIVDVMTSGEIVECTGLTAGTLYTANTTTGVISNAAASGTQTAVGFTVEATRLIVRAD